MIVLGPEARRGIDLLNSGAYYRSHDALESAWMTTSGTERHYLQGLIQIAVALYKLSEEKNWRGAVGLFATAIGHLKSVPPEKVEINLAEIISSAELFHGKLVDLGPERMGEVHADDFPKITVRQLLQ